MPTWIECAGCGGEIGIPASSLGSTVICPKCGAIVAAKSQEAVQWRMAAPPKPPAVVLPGGAPPAWLLPGWIVALAFAALWFALDVFARAFISGQHFFAVFGRACFNPLFVVGAALGVYWFTWWQRYRTSGPHVRVDASRLVGPKTLLIAAFSTGWLILMDLAIDTYLSGLEIVYTNLAHFAEGGEHSNSPHGWGVATSSLADARYMLMWATLWMILSAFYWASRLTLFLDSRHSDTRGQTR
jgi:hypothetical protein